ncbi:hypothetical protein [Bacillus sp. E(2018)]|uniref:hypothetical protein n=1 Tax=Bacillus sp. E(2018) TaxID=2502239 RepID=UPI0010F7E1A0|nr:hypothetical protein [Bacillus sp. E(2018)]
MANILWTIYLGILGTLAIGYFIKGGYKTHSAKLDFVISIITWIGLFGYVTSNELFTPLLWKVVFIGGLVWDLAYGLKKFNEDANEIPRSARPAVFGITALIMIGPLYYGLFQYAF